VEIRKPARSSLQNREQYRPWTNMPLVLGRRRKR
jgi:hypothetical protein